MDRYGPAVAEVPNLQHYLKDELYRRISADPTIFEFLQAASLDGIWYWDMENPNQEWMSPGYKALFGYADQEIPNTSAWWQQNIFSDDLAVVLSNLDRHCADASHPFDQIVRYRHKDGSTVWVRCRGLAIRDEEGKPIRMLGAHTDVTPLKRTEERLRAVYEASPEMYFVADVTTGEITECNQALRESTGLCDMGATSFLDLCESQFRTTAVSVLQTLERKPDIRDVELRFCRQTGDSFTVLLSAKVFEQNASGARSFRAWCRDIDHLKRSSNVEAILAALPTGAVLINEYGLITSSNPLCDELFGYEKGELVGRPITTLLEDVVRIQDLEKTSDLDVRGLSKDGSGFPIRLELRKLPLGEGTFFLATVADLTSRKQVELALRESEHRFRQLTESLPQLVWTCTAEGSCDYLSPQWVQYTGIPESEQLEYNWLPQLHPDDREATYRAWNAAVKLGQTWKTDYRVRRHDGVHRWFEACGIPLRNVQNRIVKWFGSCTDIHERKETRDALEQEKKRLANLVATAPAAFCSLAISRTGAYFPYLSPGVVELLGVPADQLQKDTSTLQAMLRQDVIVALSHARAESEASMSPWRSQFRISHPTKGERWIEWHAGPVRESPDTTVWHGFLTDITQRKHVESDQNFLFDLGEAMQSASTPEETVAVATRMLSEYLEASRCSLASIHFERGQATVLHAHSLEKGPSSPALTHRLSEWGTEELRARMAEGITFVVSDTATDPSTSEKYETAFRPAGIEAVLAVPLRRSGRWVGVLSLVCNKTREWSAREIDLARAAAERLWPAYETARAQEGERLMNATLKVSEERLQLALKSSRIGIWEWNRNTGKTIWDSRCKEIYGFPGDAEMTSDLALAQVHPDDREILQRHIASCMDSAGSGRFDAEYRVLTWNGAGLRYVYGQGQVIFEGTGSNRRAVRSIGTIQDVTELKKGEQALKRVNLELEQFAYAAAHDLQEPLRNVGLATQILAGRYKGKFDSDADMLLKIAVDGPMKMQAMVKDLLAYSRTLTLEEGVEVFADVNAVLSSAIRNLVVAIQEKDAQITWEKLPSVRMSELHLTQIFQNLIGNALKYSGGKQPVIQIAAIQRSGEWVFSVRDNGIGIPPEHRERAFGVFKRLHSGGAPGTGIGLALCKRIVEHYGGRIWIESNAEGGTTVLFTPPVAEMRLQTSG